MPTTLPRSAVTHTPRIQHALAVAAARWPEAAGKPGVLLANLAVEGAQRIERELAPASVPPLRLVSTGGRKITREMVEEALANEY
ncbi:MAG: hypothetical protein FWD83_04190 [Promicromonosporaceae bacterium]|nr:hypothetical protein [Promicromonosporaceae bacterium]